MPPQASITGEQLYAYVVAAADRSEESRVLLEATLPTLLECIAAVLVEKDDGQKAGEKRAMRDEVLREVACRMNERNFLKEWREHPPTGSWRFLEVWVQRFTAAWRDRAWVQRTLKDPKTRASDLLFARLRQLFDKAANTRQIPADERGEVFNSFTVWLLERGLRRWDPEGGSSFDGWFYARALNHIDTCRRRNNVTAEFLEDIAHDDSSRMAAHVHLGEIDRLLKSKCSEPQYKIFLHNLVEERSAAEIAVEMGIQPGVVYMTILRLRRYLMTFQPK